MTSKTRVRMSAGQRREQLLEVSRRLFASRGFDGTSVEEIASTADVSKPVVYEHFHGKEGIYAVVVDREVRTLLKAVRTALTTPEVGPRRVIELGALALLDYIEANPDGFRILSRDSSVGSTGGSFASILSDCAASVEDLLAQAYREAKLDPAVAPLHAQALVGMVALTGQWWLEDRQPPKEVVAAQLVNLAWNGMRNLQSTEPPPVRRPSRARRPKHQGAAS